MLLPFKDIYEQACIRATSEAELKKRLPRPKSARSLKAYADDRYLSDMCRRVFRAGLKHSLVDDRWPAFEAAFFEFQLKPIAYLSDEKLEDYMQNERLIRHWGKIKSVRSNAQFLLEIVEEHGSVGQWLAAWPEDDIVGLWTLLKKRGNNLGGNSGPYFLRMVGKDTFLMTQDNVAALKNLKVIDKPPSSQKALQTVQGVFNQWREESGRPLCEISRILSMSVG